MNKKTKFLTTAAMIAAMYVALSWVSQTLGLCSGAVQCRISEALCVLPVFTTAAIPGVTLGCLITNILFGLGPLDVGLGTLATLTAALVCWAIRKLPYLASIPTIAANALIVPLVLIYYKFSSGYLVDAGLVAVGEIIACGILGTLLVWYLMKHPKTVKALGFTSPETARDTILFLNS
ncbi:MAG: QueT transporter family protein [Clostridia bacterium]|nr:QueT transporter family protein [Clostridia bacterium]